MRPFVVIVAGVVLLAAACTNGGQGVVPTAAEDTAAPTAVTTVLPPTATRPESTNGPQTTVQPTTTPSPSAWQTSTLPPLLTFDGDGIRIVDDDLVVAEFLAGVPVEVAAPDLMGGVVYQEPGARGWDWECNAATGRIVYGGEGDAPIMWIEQPGAPAETLVSADHSPRTLLRTFWLDGRPTMMYRAMLADPDVECTPDNVESTWAAVRHHLVLQRLDDGAVIELGVVAGFESSWVDYLIGESTMVVLTESYGEGDLCGGIWPTDALLGAGGEGVWIGGGGPFWRSCDFSAGSFAMRAAVSPDGATVAYVTAAPAEDAALLVVLDAATGSELLRVTIDGWPLQPAWLDWDGTVGIFGDFEATRPVVVLADGGVLELPAGMRAMTWAQP